MPSYLRKRHKHFKRYRQIANVLAKHGFGYLLGQLGLAEFIKFPRTGHRHREEATTASKARRLRLVLEELGPTFIKLGQLLSTRSDLLSEEFVRELAKLQDEVPPFSFDQVKETVQLELGRDLYEIYTHFETRPLAAASIGQVHRAVLAGGEEVVVKVQRPGIEETMEADIEILYDLAGLLDRHNPWRRNYSLVGVVEEFDRILHEELSFTAEGKHAETFAQNFAGDFFVRFPRVYWEQTTDRVLTLEYFKGVKLSALEATENDMDGPTIARRLVDAVLRQIFIHGFFHADPHPGNIAVLPGGKVLFMDFGIVGRLDDEIREKIANLVLGLIRRSTRDVVRAIMSLGVVPRNVDFSSLRRDIEHLRDKYYEIPLQDISVAETLRDIMQVAFNHQIRVPTEFTLMVKTLITLEGITVKLDPQLSIVEAVEPLGKKILAERFSLRGLRKLIGENLLDYHAILTRLPQQLNDLLDTAAAGELKVQIEDPRQQEVIRHLHKIANRLSLSVITAGFFMGAAVLAGKGVTIFGFPAERAALLSGLLSGLMLAYSILRSRRP